MTTATPPSFGACVEPSLLAAWCSGRLDSKDRAALEHHVDGCSQCGELMAAAGRVCASATDSRVEVTPSTLLGDDLFAMSALLEAQLGPYRLDNVVGGGGLGLVFEAHDERLQRRVAIKALRRASDEPGAIRREAQALAALSHPGVIDVYDVLERSGREYLVMEFVEGQTLRAWQAGRSPVEIVAAYREVARGLAAIHHAGLIHCDIKPDNVLVAEDGRILVGDFGLSVLANRDGVADQALGGTPRYMAPEQRAREAVSFASDQYAFAATLWEALTGEIPRRRVDAIPAALRPVLERALSERAANRWPSMTALEAAMSPGRRRWPLVAAGLSLAAGLVASAFTLVEPPPDASVLDTPSLSAEAVQQTTVRHALAEAETARGRGKLLQALAVLETAIESPELSTTSRQVLQLRRAKLLDIGGRRNDAGTALDELEREANDAPDRLRAAIALELARTRPLPVSSDSSEDWLRTGQARLLRAGLDPSFDLDARRAAAEVYRQQGERDSAAKEIEAALELVGPGTSPLLHAHLLQEQAHLFDRLGRYDESEEILDRATALLKEHELEGSDVGVLVLLTRGNLQWFQGKKTRSIATLQRAIDAGEAMEGGSPVALGRALNDLGSYAMEQGQFERAESAMLRAQGMLPEYYAVTANLAILYGRMPCHDATDPKACKAQNQERAYEYTFRAYETAREQLPPGHPSLAQMAGNLAFDYSQQGRYVLALQHYDEALDGLTAAYGKDHIKLVRPLLGALEVAVRTKNQDSATRIAKQTRATADTNRETLGPAAMSVIDYALLKTNAWTSGVEADEAALETSIAFFKGSPPQDIGMVDSWFGERETETESG